MAETHSLAVDQPTAAELISFLKAIPDGRYRRGVRYPPSSVSPRQALMIKAPSAMRKGYAGAPKPLQNCAA